VSRYDTLRHWLAAEPFTLVMSSGFFSFFAHGGMLAALEEVGLPPARLAGSSAGALTGGLWAAGLSAATMRELYFSLQKKDFWDCGRPLCVSAFDLRSMRTRVLDKGDLADALYASCAVPFMFHPIRLDGGLLVDGGVSDRHGLAGVGPGRRVFYHHISSRSPWRRKGSAALRLPERHNMASLVIDDLPRSGPDALDIGRDAWRAAREATFRALDSKLAVDGVALATRTAADRGA
jgi:NTE family protein